MILACPLQWPAGWLCTLAGNTRPRKFGTRSNRPAASWVSISDLTLAEATRRMLEELSRMGIDR